MPLWVCSCTARNASKRTFCRSCGKEKREPTIEERAVFTNVTLPTMLAAKAHLKSELHKAIAEQKAIDKKLKELDQ